MGTPPRCPSPATAPLARDEARQVMMQGCCVGWVKAQVLPYRGNMQRIHWTPQPGLTLGIALSSCTACSAGGSVPGRR